MNPLLEKLKSFGKRAGGKSGPKHLDPPRDWLLLLGLALLALAASVAWNAWFFFVALNEAATAPAAPAQTQLDTSSIEKARALFEARGLEGERYKTEYHFADPSK